MANLLFPTCTRVCDPSKNNIIYTYSIDLDLSVTCGVAGGHFVLIVPSLVLDPYLMLGSHDMVTEPSPFQQYCFHLPLKLGSALCPTCCQGCGSGQATFLILMAVTVAMNWLGKPGWVMISI